MIARRCCALAVLTSTGLFATLALAEEPASPEAEEVAAKAEAEEAMPPSGYLPGRRERIGLGLSPHAPGQQTDGLAEAPSPAYVSDFLATSDGLALTKAFMRIKDAKLRRRIVDLVEQIVSDRE